jgi:predicted DsbA family dithiol-disulfide isomerase
MGKKRFEEGLSQFEGKKSVEIEFRSFELDPHAKVDGNPSVYALLEKKYGLNRERASQTLEDITRQAKQVGLNYNMDITIQTNTFDAHRLTHFAKTLGLGEVFAERLFRAHFSNGLHIGDQETLILLAEEVGMSKKDVLKVIEEDQFSEDVRLDEQDAHKLGVRGVPFFLIDGKHIISGAQSSDVFLKALRQASIGEDSQIVSL